MAVTRANIVWSAKTLAKKIAREEINTDNAVQRGFVWDDVRQSLLIHSMLTGWMPIPAFFCSKNDGKYDLLDGKQRATTVCRFLNDELKLKGMPEVEHDVEVEGETVTELLDLNGKKFSELPEDMQDTIKDFNFNVTYLDGITDDQISEMFSRLNNGKPLSAIELTRVKAKSIAVIKEIAKHDIFSTALSENALKRYTDEDIIIKAWLLLNEDDCSFDTKYVRAKMADTEITDEQKNEIETAFTRILETYNYIKDNTFDAKIGNRIAKRVVTRTHLISLVPFAISSIDDGISIEQFSKWVSTFFNGTRGTTIDEVYNTNAQQSSSKAENIRRRNMALSTSYNTYFADILATA